MSEIGRAHASTPVTSARRMLLNSQKRRGAAGPDRPPGRCSGCWRRPRRSQLRCQLFFFNDTATTEIYSLSLHDALPILVLFIPWRVGAEESGAAKNGLRAQHLNNALTECLKWGRVNLLCHKIGRAHFSSPLTTSPLMPSSASPPTGAPTPARPPPLPPL